MFKVSVSIKINPLFSTQERLGFNFCEEVVRALIVAGYKAKQNLSSKVLSCTYPADKTYV